MRPAFALTHRLSTLTALTAVCLACVTAAHSQNITIGAPGYLGIGNAFPFGNTFGGVGFTSRYQQVYNKSLLSTPIAINQITFFHTNNNIGGPGGVGIQPATYTIHLSTTGKPVNGLDASNFNANVGADDAFFFSANLGGAIGPELSFNGPAFHYDPSAGNLLLDITKVDISDPLVDIFLDAHAGTFGPIQPRRHFQHHFQHQLRSRHALFFSAHLDPGTRQHGSAGRHSGGWHGPGSPSSHGIAASRIVTDKSKKRKRREATTLPAFSSRSYTRNRSEIIFWFRHGRGPRSIGLRCPDTGCGWR